MKLSKLALLVALPLLYQSTAGAKSHSTIVENAMKFTVLVTNEGFSGSGRGSGVLLDETHVLTCFHMLNTPKDELFVYTYPLGTVIKAHVQDVSVSDDLAILVLETSATVHVKPVFTTKFHYGDSILAVGNGLGAMKWLVTGGVISGMDHENIVSDAAINPGDSGGPWINEGGEIIGITDWRIGPNAERHCPGLSGAISSTDIQHFLATRE